MKARLLSILISVVVLLVLVLGMMHASRWLFVFAFFVPIAALVAASPLVMAVSLANRLQHPSLRIILIPSVSAAIGIAFLCLAGGVDPKFPAWMVLPSVLLGLPTALLVEFFRWRTQKRRLRLACK